MTQRAEAPHQPSRASRMAAAMRATAPKGPKVLRIGVVREGRVVEERVIKPGQSVTIGPSEKCIFVTTDTGLPARFALFESRQGVYQLRFTERMAGRVRTSEGNYSLDELRTGSEPDGTYSLTIDEETRGKVSVGETTFLFQFVAPPLVQPKPQLPARIKTSAFNVDWPTTTIAALSFLVHFVALGLLYSDWMDPVVDSGLDVRHLVESIKSLPPPPELEEKVVEDEQVKKEEKPKKEDVKPEVKPKPDTEKKAKQPLTTAEVAALASELDSIDMGILAVSTGKTATASVLDSMDTISTELMDRAAASGVGVSEGGPGGLKIGSAGAAIAHGATGAGLKTIGSSGKSTSEGSGKTQVVEGPKGNANIGGTSVAGRVSGASSVIARMKAGFRACFNRGLASNPDASGQVMLRISVGPGGEVSGVQAQASGNLPGSVVSCIKSRAMRGQFAQPEGGSAVVMVPVTFVKQ